jgi:Protein of unknown function (DUF3572)
MLGRRSKLSKTELQADAEAMAATAFAWLAADAERLGRFLALTGMEPGDLRERAGEPEMLTEVLGHLLMDEPSLLAFAADHGFSPETVVKAEALLRGPTGEW